MQSPYNNYSPSSSRIKKESPPFGGKICIGNPTTSSTVREEGHEIGCDYCKKGCVHLTG